MRIVERAETPRAPISPNRTRNYQIALLIGLAIGIGLTLLFENFDNTVRTPEDVKAMNLPFLGHDPRGGAGGGHHDGAARRPSVIRKGRWRKRIAWCAPTCSSRRRPRADGR